MKTIGTKLGMSMTLVLALMAALPALSMPKAESVEQQLSAPNDNKIQAELQRDLNKDRFKNVQVSVKNGIVELTGTVGLFADKEEVDRKAHRVRNIKGLMNQIQIAGAERTDQDLQTKLTRQLEYDRVGYGTTTFNAITVSVRDGVVRLGGHAYSPTDKFSAISVASYTPGVQDVIDDIEVDPVSPMDDSIRVSLARAVYGQPSLNKYAIDPARPIRISVQNGAVTLYGVVDTAAERDIAGISANSVPGVFKVSNQLRLSGEASELE